MSKKLTHLIAASAVLTLTQGAAAGTATFFNPLTQSGVVAEANAVVEMNSPWLTPAGVVQQNLTSLDEVEADVAQSILRVPGAGTSASMFDMMSFDSTGENLFIPHETPFGAGVTRYSITYDFAETLFSGDLGGATGDWSNDYAAFDPSTFTPFGTLLVGEEWAGEGRIIEILNPMAPAGAIKIRELDSIANVAHEGLRFSKDGMTLYFVDEWNSGAIYKFVMTEKGDLTRGQTFVLRVDAYDGNAADYYNEASNKDAERTGKATWVPLTNKKGQALTSVDPFRNGPTDDPRTSSVTRGGRPAADEVGATPYGRPEDMEIGLLANGHEVLYFTATSEQAVYSIEMLNARKAKVRLAASEFVTPKNAGFAPTSATLNSPDNLAQDALGNIYIIEDAPNGSSTGGDIWFLRDADTDGVAESLDHFLTIQVAGSEATGMIFNPVKPTEFVVAVQHPLSADLDQSATGFGDAIWHFDLAAVAAPPCSSDRAAGPFRVCAKNGGRFVKELERAAKRAARQAAKASR